MVAELTLVSQVAHTLPTDRVTAAVCEITIAPSVTGGSPPAFSAFTDTGSLITRRQVAVASAGTFLSPVAPVALTLTSQLVAAKAQRCSTDTLAWLGAAWRVPALVACAVSVNGVAATVPATLAGILAQRTPAVGVAGALPCDGITAAVWVALTHLATVWCPEIRRTAWKQTNKQTNTDNTIST